MSERFYRPEGRQPPDPRRVFVPAPDGTTVDRPKAPRPAPPGAPGHRPPPRGPEGRPRPPQPRPAPDAPGRPATKPWWRRIRWRRVLLITGAVVGLALLAGFLWVRSIFNSIERVEVGEVLADGGSGRNYLIVGSDSRDNLQPGDPGFDENAPTGSERSDTMMLLHLEGGEAKMMSIPRDLYLPIAETGGSAKINAAYNGGPQRLIRTIDESLGIPVHRYIEVDFVSFASLVDAVGGVTIDFPNPAFDTKSGLNVTTSGPVELDGEQALAYVRSRTYTEVINGEEVVDPTADLGRITRQQRFLTSVLNELGDEKNPIALARAADGMAEGLRIDDEMDLLDAIRLVWTLRGLDPEPVELPVDVDRNEAGSVVLLREPDAQSALDQFR